MFENLSDRFQKAFRNFRGVGKLSESNTADTLREVRMALLEADVNFKVARDFVEKVKEKALGAEVTAGVDPGHQFIKIIYDELVTLMSGENQQLSFDQNPTIIMMVGLHGSGKTTSTGKLARLVQKKGRQPMLVAADVYRPAAVDQLKTLGQQLGVPVFARPGDKDVVGICRAALAELPKHHANVLLIDTAGRLQIDQELVQELVRVKEAVNPQEILLVCDAAVGQEAVNIAQHFNDALSVTGIVLTKVDGDARGGAALSMRAVTNKPIKFVGTGEKLEEFEPFHPDRISSRILGMGDVVSLVEKAEEAIDQKDAVRMQAKMQKGEFDLQDFLDQMMAMKKLGPLENLLGMLPGMGNMRDLSVDEGEFSRMAAIIQSMTPRERKSPEILNSGRKFRISRGSGVRLAEVNALMKRFLMMKKLMKNMGKMQKWATKMGGLPALARQIKP